MSCGKGSKYGYTHGYCNVPQLVLQLSGTLSRHACAADHDVITDWFSKTCMSHQAMHKYADRVGIGGTTNKI